MDATAHVIVDRQTGAIVSKPYGSRSRARHRADKLDNEYGAYRYDVRSTEPATPPARAILRFHNDRVTVLCPIGHLVTVVPLDRSFAGSSDEAELGAHGAGMPNRWDRLAGRCDGAGHVCTVEG